MDSTLESIRESLRRADTLTRLIYLNTGLFLLVTLLEVGFMLFNHRISGVLSLFYLPSDITLLLTQPWSLVTYMFLHDGILHLVLNMIWLYFMGRLFTMLFSMRHLLGLYILGGLSGGVFFILCYNLFPYFASMAYNSYVVGSSASVLAIAVATAAKAPSYRMHLMFLGSIRLKYIVLALIILDMLMITDTNGGGHIAHLGGAMMGYLFTRCLEKGRDLTAWINWILDIPLRIEDFTRSRRKPSDNSSSYHYRESRREDGKESASMDEILEKVRRSGYQSLSEEEKKRLFYGNK